MKIKIVAVGKIKEQFYRQALDEYVKRISRFAQITVEEVDEYFCNGTPNDKQIAKIVQAECELIAKRLEGYVIAMDIDGKQMDSVSLAKHLQQQTQTHSVFTFVIGGSNGLSKQLKDCANLRLSFGQITLPHQLFRVVLSEQIYRCCCINNNVAYHK